jgi:hypothetical protein
MKRWAPALDWGTCEFFLSKWGGLSLCIEEIHMAQLASFPKEMLEKGLICFDLDALRVHLEQLIGLS